MFLIKKYTIYVIKTPVYNSLHFDTKLILMHEHSYFTAYLTSLSIKKHVSFDLQRYVYECVLFC